MNSREIVLRTVEFDGPERVAGRLLNYHYDPQRAVLECTWREEASITAPSRVYLPDWFAWDERAIELTPASSGFEVIPTHSGSQTVFLTIPPTGGPCERRLAVGRAVYRIVALSEKV